MTHPRKQKKRSGFTYSPGRLRPYEAKAKAVAEYFVPTAVFQLRLNLDIKDLRIEQSSRKNVRLL